MELLFWAATDVGLTRDHNEDNYLVDRKLNLFVVADGMGGHAAGEIASSVAVHEVRKTLMNQREVIERYERSGSVLLRQTVLTLIEQAISNACSLVYQLAQEDSERHGMGTTLSLLLLARNRGFVGHVGDSRIYRTRRGEVSMVTEDHSVINELIKSGRIRPEDAFNSPYKNAVTRAVGVHPNVEVDTFDFELRADDNYLLCSDGLSCYLEDPLTLDLMTRDDVKQIPQLMIDHANDSGGKDNITAVVIRVTDIESVGTHTNFGSAPPPPPLPGLTASSDDELHDLSISDESLSDLEDLSASNLTAITDTHTESAPPPLPSNPSGGLGDGLPTPASQLIDQLPLNVLKLSPLFALLQTEELEALVARAGVIRLDPEGVLHVQGDQDETLYAVLSGELRAERDDVEQYLLSVGALCGEQQLLAPSAAEMTIVAQEETTLLAWSMSALRDLMERSPEVSARFMWGLASLNMRRYQQQRTALDAVCELFESRLSDQDQPKELTRQLERLSQESRSPLEVYAPIKELPSFVRQLSPVNPSVFARPIDDAEDVITGEIAALRTLNMK